MGKGKRTSGSAKKKKGKNKGHKKQVPPPSDEDTAVAPTPDTSNEHAASSQRTTPFLPSIHLNPNRPLSKLETLAPHLLFKIVNHLEQREKDILFHVVTGNAIEEESDDNDGENGESNNNESTRNENGGQNHSQQQHSQQQQHPLGGGAGTNSNNNNARWRVPMEFVATDPDTLLARLNTRRLHKRLQESDGRFPPNATTEEIALLEWNLILERATQQGRVAEEELPPTISPSRELLMFTPCPRSVAVLASYPRSGNSLLRSLYEKITLRVSGSDMRGGLVSHDLVVCNYAYECVLNELMWCTTVSLNKHISFHHAIQ